MKPGKDWLKKWQLEKDYYTNESIYHCEGVNEIYQLIKDNENKKEENGNGDETRGNNNES